MPNEIPDPQPTTDIAWAEASGNVLEPGAGVKSAGWQVEQVHPSNNENWLRRENARHINHASSIAVRTFDTVQFATDELPPGRVFRVDEYLPRRLGEALIPIALGGADEAQLIAADGLNYYVADQTNGEVRAYAADPFEPLSELWSFAAAGFIPLRMKTDGACVAVASASAAPTELIVINARTGATLLLKPLGVLCRDCEPDSDFDVSGGGYRVYYTDGVDIRIWTNPGLDTLFVTSTGNVLALCATADTVLAIANDTSGGPNGVQLIAYDKNTPGAGTVLAAFPSWPKDSPAAIFSDGEIAYVALYRSSVAAAPLVTAVPIRGPVLPYVAGAPFWSVNLATSGTVGISEINLEADDRFVFVKGAAFEHYVLDKRTGGVVWYQSGNVLNAAIDGTFIWQTDLATQTQVNALGTGRQAGLWQRAGAGQGSPEDSSFGSRRKPFKKLAIPIR